MPSETTSGYFDLMNSYLKQHGSPAALYADKQQHKQSDILDSKCLNETLDTIQTEAPKKKYKPSYHHAWKRGPCRKSRYQPQ
jgi:hypothetical protein